MINSGPATAVISVLDLVLVPEAVKSLKEVFDLQYTLSVNDAAKEFLKKLEDPNTDKRTRAVLQRHADAVYAGVAEAARTGDTKLLEKALRDTYADTRRESAAATTRTVKDLVGQYGRGGTDSGKVFTNNLEGILRGPLPVVKPHVSTAGITPANQQVTELHRKLERIDGYRARATAFVDVKWSDPKLAPSFRLDPDNLRFRARGGPVLKNGAYIVGEREPELFVPDRDGQIYNQKQMRSLMGGGGVTNNYVTINNPDPRPATEVHRALRETEYLLGRG